MAVANLRAGLLNDARDAIEEAVRIRKKTLGEQSSKVAVSGVVVQDFHCIVWFVLMRLET